MKIDRRRVLEPADLLAHFLDDLGMTVADRDGDDPGEGVEVLLAGLVPDVLHVAFDDQERLAIIRDQARREVLSPHRQHFVARGTVIGGRRVWGDRQRSRGGCVRLRSVASHCVVLLGFEFSSLS